MRGFEFEKLKEQQQQIIEKYFSDTGEFHIPDDAEQSLKLMEDLGFYSRQ